MVNLLPVCKRGQGSTGSTASPEQPLELSWGMAWGHCTEGCIFSPISRCPRLGEVKEHPAS